jgi:N-acyl-D-aspartate/D-glutamate deacylase
MDRYTILRCRQAEYEGKTVGEIVRAGGRGTTTEWVYERSLETLFDLLVEDPGITWALSLDNRGTPRTHGILLSHPAGMPCTDTIAYPASLQGGGTAEGHGVSPSAFGLYPGYLKTYVQDRKVLSLEEAVKKATSVPAQDVFGLKDRGTIREGAYADLVMFDFERISEAGDLRAPTRPPTGIQRVFVNGAVVHESGSHTGIRSGRILRRCGS